MDSFEINKLVAAVLLVVLLVIGIGKISNLLFNVESQRFLVIKLRYLKKFQKLWLKKKKRSRLPYQLMAQADLAHGEKSLKNVQHVTQYKQVGETKLDQLYTMLWEEKLLH